MSEGVFLVAGAIACGTLLMIVKTIAGAFGAKGSHADVAQLRDQFEHCATILEETQATVASQSAQLAELQERVDFAERMLAQTREREALPRGEDEERR